MQSKVDLSSLLMVVAFTSNLVICYFDPFKNTRFEGDLGEFGKEREGTL